MAGAIPSLPPFAPSYRNPPPSRKRGWEEIDCDSETPAGDVSQAPTKVRKLEKEASAPDARYTPNGNGAQSAAARSAFSRVHSPFISSPGPADRRMFSLLQRATCGYRFVEPWREENKPPENLSKEQEEALLCQADNNRDRYRLVKKLQSTHTNRVFRAKDIQTGETVVIKMNKRPIDPNSADTTLHNVKWTYSQAKKEEENLQFSKTIRHAARFRDSFLCAPFLQCHVLDHYPEDLFDLSYSHPNGLPISLLKRVAKQLFEAAFDLHKKETLFRDFKPENTCIEKDSQGVPSLRIIDWADPICLKPSQGGTYDNNLRAGTAMYAEPEVLLGFPYQYSRDIWAIGVILFNVYTLKGLFGHTSIDRLPEEQADNAVLHGVISLLGLPPENYTVAPNWLKFFRRTNEGALQLRHKAPEGTVIRDKRAVENRLLKKGQEKRESEGDVRLLIDLLSKIFTWGPRLSAEQALAHPFLAGTESTPEILSRPESAGAGSGAGAGAGAGTGAGMIFPPAFQNAGPGPGPGVDNSTLQ